MPTLATARGAWHYRVTRVCPEHNPGSSRLVSLKFHSCSPLPPPRAQGHDLGSALRGRHLPSRSSPPTFSVCRSSGVLFRCCVGANERRGGTRLGDGATRRAGKLWRREHSLDAKVDIHVEMSCLFPQLRKRRGCVRPPRVTTSCSRWHCTRSGCRKKWGSGCHEHRHVGWCRPGCLSGVRLGSSKACTTADERSS